MPSDGLRLRARIASSKTSELTYFKHDPCHISFRFLGHRVSRRVRLKHAVRTPLPDDSGEFTCRARRASVGVPSEGRTRGGLSVAEKPVLHGLGIGNGSLLEYPDGSVEYRQTGKVLSAFRVGVRDVTGFSAQGYAGRQEAPQRIVTAVITAWPFHARRRTEADPQRPRLRLRRLM